MVPRAVKATFYSLCGPAMRVNASVYRLWRAPSKGVVKVHLGPGQRGYIPGWINVDANIVSAKIDLWADLQHGIPFRDATVDVFYSHHVVEHLPDLLLPAHFRELHRALKPGGIIRVGGPNSDSACRKYLEGDLAWFDDFPDPHPSIGGKLVNFIFCRGEHLTALTPSYLQELAGGAGFTDMRICKPVTETGYPHLIDAAVLEKEWETTPHTPHTLILEARKPLDNGRDSGEAEATA